MADGDREALTARGFVVADQRVVKLSAINVVQYKDEPLAAGHMDDADHG